MTTVNPDIPAEPADPAVSYDEMSKVFDSLAEPKKPDEEVPPAPAAAAPAAADPAPPATPVAETPPAEPAPAAPATLPGEPAAAEPPAAATAEPEIDWKARFEELERRQAAAPVAAPAPAATAPIDAPADTAPPKFAFTEAELATLKEYETNWPDIAAAEAIRRKGEYVGLVDYVFKEFNRVYGAQIMQGAAAADRVSTNVTLNAIWAAHEDYNDQMYEAIKGWAGGLTGYEGTLARGIIENGEIEDVIGLVSKYKQVHGLDKPRIVAGTAAPAAAAPAGTALSAAAKQAAKALGVVDSKRSATAPQGVDPNDFDAAWAEATASGS